MKTWNFVRFLLNKEGANMKKVIYSTNTKARGGGGGGGGSSSSCSGGGGGGGIILV
ncbi:hypothetical protein [Photorhabdus stackebrandtii]|uniref:hypothetical protein n=1 Tax=Photorhabdus stackebrandtii TaxID=1123042 RepID=UPI0014096B82|nr:hypothetical protein [Photorhabdus stackebrandtii]